MRRAFHYYLYLAETWTACPYRQARGDATSAASRIRGARLAAGWPSGTGEAGGSEPMKGARTSA